MAVDEEFRRLIGGISYWRQTEGREAFLIACGHCKVIHRNFPAAIWTAHNLGIIKIDYWRRPLSLQACFISTRRTNYCFGGSKEPSTKVVEKEETLLWLSHGAFMKKKTPKLQMVINSKFLVCDENHG